MRRSCARPFAAITANVLLTLALCLPAMEARAFVFLDTSAEKPAEKPVAKDSVNSPTPPRVKPAVDTTVPAGPPHFRNVLFLSADDMTVYAYIGVLKALEEYKVRIDLVLAESKAMAVAGPWGLGYSASQTERLYLQTPLRGLVTPFQPRRDLRESFSPYGPDAMQVEIPLDIDRKDTPENSVTAVGGEYLQLSWLMARLTHDAPGGPVTDLQATPRRLAVQVTDLVSGQGFTLTDGELQNVIKGSILPKEAVRNRPHLRHYASGSILTGHSMMTPLPFTFDRVLEVTAGPRLHPPSLEEGEASWTDSLSRRILKGAADQAGAAATAGKTLRIELSPESWFDAKSAEPHEWIDLGYTSALKSMDVILSSLGADSSARPASPAREEARLDLASGNHVVSGGNVLLLNLIEGANRAGKDSSGDESMATLMRSGYYSDLDVEWVPGIAQEGPSLVFEATEKTKLVLRAGANAAYAQEEITDRPPEVGAELSWSEPFYVPFRAEVFGILGGHRPGIRGRLVAAPVVPFPMELGITRTHWEIDYPDTGKETASLDAWHMRVRRDLTRLSLRLSPFPDLYFITAGERHEMSVPDDIYLDPGEFLSNDFEQQGFLGFGGKGPSGVSRQSLWVRGRYLTRESLPGLVKDPFSSVETRLRLSAGDFRLLHQYYWSDQGLESFASDPGKIYDSFQLGSIAAFSFQDEFFSMALRSPLFQNAQLEYCPTFGKAGLRLVAGGFQLYGPKLKGDRTGRDTRAYWEAQAAYATPVGPLRAGLAGLAGERPIFFLRLGADLDLEESGPPR